MSTVKILSCSKLVNNKSSSYEQFDSPIGALRSPEPAETQVFSTLLQLPRKQLQCCFLEWIAWLLSQGLAYCTEHTAVAVPWCSWVCFFKTTNCTNLESDTLHSFLWWPPCQTRLYTHWYCSYALQMLTGWIGTHKSRLCHLANIFKEL